MKAVWLRADAICMSIAFFVSLGSSSAQPGPEPWPGLTPSEPVVCGGDEDSVIQGYLIKTAGNGVLVDVNCDIQISDSHIVAGRAGILVRGNGNVELRNCYIEGGEAAIEVQGNGSVTYSGNTLRGGTKASQNAELVDRGGNKVLAGAAVAPSVPADRESEVRIGATGIEGSEGSISIGPGGVVVSDNGGDRVAVREDAGVSLFSGDASVVADSGAVRLREGNEAVTITGDWRVVTGTLYKADDTARLLTELGATSTGGEIQLQLAGDVLFDFNSAAVRADAVAQLAKVAHVMRQRATGQIDVVGHTDSVGGDEYNLKLSRQRAAAVMRWLNEKEGIPASMLVGHGMGSKKPVAHNTMPDGSDDPSGRAKNRRVEIRFASSQ
ncbi:MAG: OmpA family protein [Acidobacteria bacterium]|nr:OmpA family protein [Acidobacteriota bacterium]